MWCKMGNKYGIYQSSKTSCIFYKEDDDGKQSTFNLFVSTDPQIKELVDKKVFYLCPVVNPDGVYNSVEVGIPQR